MKSKIVILALALIVSLGVFGCHITDAQCTFEISNPQDDEVVEGTITVTISSTCQLDAVMFFIDCNWVKSDVTEPFSYSWATCSYSDGEHSIFAVGYYQGKIQGMDTVICETYNNIRITNPQDTEWVSETVTITAYTPCPATAVLFYVDGNFIGADYSGPYQWQWDTTSYSNGEHTIKVIRYYGGQGRDYDEITVTVVNY